MGGWFKEVRGVNSDSSEGLVQRVQFRGFSSGRAQTDSDTALALWHMACADVFVHVARARGVEE